MKKVDNYLREWSIPLVVGVVVALYLANFDHQLYRQLVSAPFGGAEIFGHAVTVKFLLNDLFMAFFFGLAAKEIREAMLPGGSLNPVRAAINPLFATVGGVLGPALTYIFLSAWTFGTATAEARQILGGWGIPTATDIALAWLVARLVFGAKHPAVNFLLLLAVVDDGIGLGIIAVAYPDPVHPAHPEWLLLVVGAALLARFLNRHGESRWWVYVLGPGVLSWSGLLLASLHPALALVPVVAFMPHERRDTGLFVRASQNGHHSALHELESRTKLAVDYGLFLFAFANAGVAFAEVNGLTAVVAASLVAGKTIGIAAFGVLAIRLGFRLPQGMGTRHLLVAGLVAGMGLTVSLFVAGQAFPDGSPFQGPAKMGALFSAVAAPLALLAAKLFRIKKITA